MATNKFTTRPLNKYLEGRFGGKWTYQIQFGWECDDGVRYVWRVATGLDHNGEYTGESSKCLYYRDGRTPEWI